MPDSPSHADAAFEKLLLPAHPTSLLAPDRFVVGGRRVSPQTVTDVLRPLLTDARRQRIEQILDGRTYTVATVLDGLVNSGNVSAVMRSAEGLGFAPVHIVTGEARYKHSSRTSKGAEKWLDVWRWPSPSACAEHLKREGYRIVVTHLDAAVPIEQIDFTRRTALVLGNEAEGVSPEMLAHANQRVIIPMLGFVESFNISVAAAVALYQAYRDRMQRQGQHGDLSPDERAALRAEYYRRSVKSAERVLERALGGEETKRR